MGKHRSGIAKKTRIARARIVSEARGQIVPFDYLSSLLTPRGSNLPRFHYPPIPSPHSAFRRYRPVAIVHPYRPEDDNPPEPEQPAPRWYLLPEEYAVELAADNIEPAADNIEPQPEIEVIDLTQDDPEPNPGTSFSAPPSPLPTSTIHHYPSDSDDSSSIGSVLHEYYDYILSSSEDVWREFMNQFD